MVLLVSGVLIQMWQFCKARTIRKALGADPIHLNSMKNLSVTAIVCKKTTQLIIIARVQNLFLHSNIRQIQSDESAATGIISLMDQLDSAKTVLLFGIDDVDFMLCLGIKYCICFLHIRKGRRCCMLHRLPY